jgi:hypothetical protein
VLFLVHRFLSPWWRRRQVPPKRRFLQEPHGVTSQKTAFFKQWVSLFTTVHIILRNRAVLLPVRKDTNIRHSACSDGLSQVVPLRLLRAAPCYNLNADSFFMSSGLVSSCWTSGGITVREYSWTVLCVCILVKPVGTPGWNCGWKETCLSDSLWNFITSRIVFLICNYI